MESHNKLTAQAEHIKNDEFLDSGAFPREVIEKMFIRPRTNFHWLEKPVDAEKLRGLYELTKFTPTAFNSSPLRIIYVSSDESRKKLLPCVMPGNRSKVESAPVCAILCYDLDFHSHFDKLSPYVDSTPLFSAHPEFIEPTAHVNGLLMCSRFFSACTALGLDYGPITGFYTKKLDDEFLSGTSYKSVMLVNIGYGNPELLFPRAPRLDYEEACQTI